jgi:hypothetical protein
VADRVDADARLGRRTRPGRQHQLPRLQRRDPFQRDLVVAEHPHLGAELTEVLHQVEGEAVVVVDHQQHVRSILLISLDVLRDIHVSYPL